MARLANWQQKSNMAITRKEEAARDVARLIPSTSRSSGGNPQQRQQQEQRQQQPAAAARPQQQVSRNPTRRSPWCRRAAPLLPTKCRLGSRRPAPWRWIGRTSQRGFGCRPRTASGGSARGTPPRGGRCRVEAGGLGRVESGTEVGGCSSGGKGKQAGSGCRRAADAPAGRAGSTGAGSNLARLPAAAAAARSAGSQCASMQINICAHHIAAEQAVAVAHQDASCQLAARPTSLPLQQRLRGHKPYPAHQPAPAEHARIGAAAHRTSGGVARSAAPSSRPGNWRKELLDCSLLRSKLSPAR